MAKLKLTDILREADKALDTMYPDVVVRDVPDPVVDDDADELPIAWIVGGVAAVALVLVLLIALAMRAR